MFFIYSCGKDAQDSKKEEIVLTKSKYNLENRTNNLDEFRSFNLNFPQGTIISFNDFGIQFDLPEPFYILGIDGNGNFYRSLSGGAGTVTCSCTSGSGCDPIKNGDEYGCLMKSGCSECKKSTSKIVGNDVNLVEMIIVNPEYKMGVDNFNELNGQSLLPNKFIEANEFKDLFTELNELMRNEDGAERKLVLINAFGYIIPFDIPSESDNTSIYFKPINDGSGTGASTCSCKIPGHSCPKESKWGVVWCNSNNCTTCSLSGKIIDKNGYEKNLITLNGNIVVN
jgi:hypothetical protein